MKTSKISRPQAGLKIGTQVNSVVNWMMSKNNTLPEVGKGATQLHWTDRTVFEVIEVSKDYKTVKLESLEAEWDKTRTGGVGHQNWIFKPTGHFTTVVWRNNAWRIKTKEIVFTEEFKKSATTFALAKSLTPEQYKAVYENEVWPKNVVEGITRESYKYPQIKILFGCKDYYYDWQF